VSFVFKKLCVSIIILQPWCAKGGLVGQDAILPYFD
jgi:hypothetical protein